jgi:hypothetical protein
VGHPSTTTHPNSQLIQHGGGMAQRAHSMQPASVQRSAAANGDTGTATAAPVAAGVTVQAECSAVNGKVQCVPPGSQTDSGRVKRRYLAQFTPSEVAEWAAAALPERLGGWDFLQRYGPHVDAVTTVDATMGRGSKGAEDEGGGAAGLHNGCRQLGDNNHCGGSVSGRNGCGVSAGGGGEVSGSGQRMYAVRQPALHPIYEHARCRTFAQLLSAPPSAEQCALLGELMLQSHASYGACGLGSAGTDRCVVGVGAALRCVGLSSSTLHTSDTDQPVGRAVLCCDVWLLWAGAVH